MPCLPRRARECAAAAPIAGAAALGVVVPGGHAAAAPARSHATVHHPNLMQALKELPDYFPGVVHWRLSTSWKHYGTTNWDTNTITISAFTPRVMNRHFGGAGKSGQRGVEYSADCMAVPQGVTWTDYTPCHNKKWRRYALRLLRGHRLKALPAKTSAFGGAETDASSGGTVTYGAPPEPDRS